MSCEEEVISVRKQLERMSKEGGDQTQALDLLKALGKLPINLQVLTNTRCSFFWAFCYSDYTDALVYKIKILLMSSQGLE